MNKRVNFAMMAAAIGAMGSAMMSPALGERFFSGNQTCKNPGCRTMTMSSEFCCLACACEAKRKKREAEEGGV